MSAHALTSEIIAARRCFATYMQIVTRFPPPSPRPTRDEAPRPAAYSTARPRRTHCKRGHALTPDNVRIELGNRQRCLACERRREARRCKARKHARRQAVEGGADA